MSTGRYTSLEEARKNNEIERFCKEHPSEGNRSLFDKLFEKMAKGKSAIRKK